MDKRTLLAIFLCTVIFVGYMFFLQATQPPMPKQPAQTPGPTQPVKTETPAIGAHQQTPANEGQKTQEPPVKTYGPLQAEAGKEHTLETKTFKAVFTSTGGALKELTSKNFFSDTKKEHNLPFLTPGAAGQGNFLVSDPNSSADLAKIAWEMKPDNQSVSFRQITPEGLEIQKTFTLDGDGNTFKFTMIVHPHATVTASLTFIPFSHFEHDSTYRAALYMNGFAGVRDGDAIKVSYLSIPTAPQKIQDARIAWAGIKNRYFTAVLIPKQTDAIDHYEFLPVVPDPAAAPGTPGNMIGQVMFKGQKFQDQDLPFETTVYVGPIKTAILKDAGSGLEVLMDYTGFDFVGSFILWLMNLFSVVFFGNYGIAIIFTTLAVRLLMFPVSKKSMVSTFKMQQLQPKLTVLKEKYKKDQQKYAQEQWKLFKESGVSPFSGCLALFLQFPIFIGMYSVFDISVDLRQSSFLFWMDDLSQPDRLGSLPFAILGTKELNLLPILMIITWVMQAVMAPKSTDPSQAMQRKMMLFMPLIFGLLCYGLASGLSLYFTVNAISSMIEQKLIRKYFMPQPQT